MPFANPLQPSLTDFLVFLNESVQIPVSALPVGSPWPGYAYAQAIDMVPWGPMGIMYVLAVYNLATHLLLMITPDQPGQTFFVTARSNGQGGYDLNAPVMGFVSSSSDNGTSASLATPNWAAGLTLGQLGYSRTPWGRVYLEWVQAMGPTIIDLT